jgi:hypothetical protein
MNYSVKYRAHQKASTLSSRLQRNTLVINSEHFKRKNFNDESQHVTGRVTAETWSGQMTIATGTLYVTKLTNRYSRQQLTE